MEDRCFVGFDPTTAWISSHTLGSTTALVLMDNEFGLISSKKSPLSFPGSSVENKRSYKLMVHGIAVDASTQCIIPPTFSIPSGVTPARVSFL